MQSRGDEALDVELTDHDLDRLDAALPQGAVQGERYADMSSIGR